MSAKKSKVVTLRISPERLLQFPHEPKPVETKTPRSKSTTSSTSTPSATPAVEPTPSLMPSESADTPAPDAATTVNGSLAVPPPQPARRKGIPGPKPGSKRNIQHTLDGVPKPRGKPGPKKKPRPGDLVNGEPFSGPAPVAPAKLNPKANQGAINANLRALDRTGKPCRKWERKGFAVKSFTGIMWAAPSWKAPPSTRAELNGDVKSDESSSGLGDGMKPNVDSSAVPSEGSKSDMNGDTTMIDVASSPARLVDTPVA
ncbi:hypothetical protein NA57DRAFT_74477 [Rhizodiscina lignyota]|uniref:INO80 complex, subunit Ies4 n=1 Tax=Rhizodiscina lignyota TaxID=1504668 RepID=A0A9P4IJ10_9PEZI|nr:hypothetical protein NA57DRAFT_74477 [Rhizodiscina lignyota]